MFTDTVINDYLCLHHADVDKGYRKIPSAKTNFEERFLSSS